MYSVEEAKEYFEKVKLLMKEGYMFSVNGVQITDHECVEIKDKTIRINMPVYKNGKLDSKFLVVSTKNYGTIKDTMSCHKPTVVNDLSLKNAMATIGLPAERENLFKKIKKAIEEDVSVSYNGNLIADVQESISITNGKNTATYKMLSINGMVIAAFPNNSSFGAFSRTIVFGSTSVSTKERVRKYAALRERLNELDKERCTIITEMNNLSTDSYTME